MRVAAWSIVKSLCNVRMLMRATAAAAALAVGTAGHANLIGQWNFNDGTAADSSGSANVYDLNIVGAGPTFHDGMATFPGTASDYLEAQGPGGEPQYTVSLWHRTDTSDQGGYKGLMCNNTSSGAANSWQLAVHNGDYRLNTQAFGAVTFGTPRVDRWENIVLRKRGGGGPAEVFRNGSRVLTYDGNPGGLQWFRLGINRNSDNGYATDMDDVQVWNTLEDPAAIYAAGPAVA